MIEQVPAEFVASLLADIGVKAAKGVFGLLAGGDSKASASPSHDSDSDLAESAESSGETPLFLARQRLHHRIELARAKWSWLVAATYYHPTRGQIHEIPSSWRPRAIAGQFTVADFASRDLPHESYLGESAQSDIRLRIIQGRITIAAEIRDTLTQIESAMIRAWPSFHFRDAPWENEGARLAWMSLIAEVRTRRFAGLPQFNSFCGFKNLWSMRDTPASGISSRDTGALSTTYGYVAELAWILAQTDSELGRLYAREFDKKHELPHQYALRKVAVRMLDSIWQHVGADLIGEHKGTKRSNKPMESPRSGTRKRVVHS